MTKKMTSNRLQRRNLNYQIETILIPKSITLRVFFLEMTLEVFKSLTDLYDPILLTPFERQRAAQLTENLICVIEGSVLDFV